MFSSTKGENSGWKSLQFKLLKHTPQMFLVIHNNNELQQAARGLIGSSEGKFNNHSRVLIGS